MKHIQVGRNSVDLRPMKPQKLISVHCFLNVLFGALSSLLAADAHV